jgi:hypothetical protein
VATQLSAVNELLETIGEAPVASLQTGQATDAGQAEVILDRERKRILMRGWMQNEEEDLPLHYASVSLTGTITGIPFLKGERVTQATSGAVGIITEGYGATNTTYLICPVDGSAAFDGTNDITGSVSTAATDTITAVSKPLTGVIQFEQDVIKAMTEPVDRWRNVIFRNTRAYDVDDRSYLFSNSLKWRVHRFVPTSELTEPLAQYVIQRSAFRYQRFKKRGITDDKMVKEMLALSYAEAMQEETDSRRENTLETLEAKRLRGRRRFSNRESALGWT